MSSSYAYEEKAVPFTQKSFSIAETPDLKNPSVHVFGNKDASGQSQLLTIDLKTRSPTQALKLEKGYSSGVIYNPPTQTLLQAQSDALLVHKLGINQVTRIKHNISQPNSGPALSRVVGELTLLLQGSTLVMVNLKNLKFSRLDIGEPGFQCLDFVHTGANTIGVLVRSTKNREQAAVKIFDILKKELLNVFKMKLKSQNGNEKLNPRIFFNYSKKMGVVFRGTEDMGREKIVGVSTFCLKSMETKSNGFKIAMSGKDESSIVEYSQASNSLYLATKKGQLYQIRLESGGSIGGLGTFKGLEALCTHPLWDGVMTVFRPENKVLRLGFVVKTN